MSQKSTALKAVHKAEREMGREIRKSFHQDFKFFTDTLQNWPFAKRLRFCLDVMRKNL